MAFNPTMTFSSVGSCFKNFMLICPSALCLWDTLTLSTKSPINNDNLYVTVVLLICKDIPTSL